RADEDEKLRPAAYGDEVQSRVRAAEDEHLAEVLEREEWDERDDAHHEERDDVARARHAPVGSRKLAVVRREYSGEADEEGNLRRLPGRHVAAELTGARPDDSAEERHERREHDDEALALHPVEVLVLDAEPVREGHREEGEERNPCERRSERAPDRGFGAFKNLRRGRRLRLRRVESHRLLLVRAVELVDET